MGVVTTYAGDWNFEHEIRMEAMFCVEKKKKGTKLVQRAISKARQDSENGELEEMRRGRDG